MKYCLFKVVLRLKYWNEYFINWSIKMDYTKFKWCCVEWYCILFKRIITFYCCYDVGVVYTTFLFKGFINDNYTIENHNINIVWENGVLKEFFWFFFYKKEDDEVKRSQEILFIFYIIYLFKYLYILLYIGLRIEI